MGAYLNQDWPFEYPDIWAAVADFVTDTSAETREEARLELIQILDRGLSESALDLLLLDRYGCAYNPRGDGYTYEEWLRELEVRLRPTSDAPPGGHGVTPGS